MTSQALQEAKAMKSRDHSKLQRDLNNPCDCPQRRGSPTARPLLHTTLAPHAQGAAWLPFQ